MSNVFYENGTMVIDLHSLLVSEAEVLLEQQMDNLPANISSVKVVHGYHGGSALLDLVRKDFKHRKIKRKRIGLNKGITFFEL